MHQWVWASHLPPPILWHQVHRRVQAERRPVQCCSISHETLYWGNSTWSMKTSPSPCLTLHSFYHLSPILTKTGALLHCHCGEFLTEAKQQASKSNLINKKAIFEYSENRFPCFDTTYLPDVLKTIFEKYSGFWLSLLFSNKNYIKALPHWHVKFR